MKKIFSITIDEALIEKFKESTDELCINKSSLISKMITEWMQNNSKSGKKLLLEQGK